MKIFKMTTLENNTPVPIRDQVWAAGASPKVSIVCITYNHASYIRKCIEGFLMQETSFPVEIIIRDDCSTDGTTAIIREYEAKYPKIIRPVYEAENQYSKGIRPSPVALKHARGEFIAMCEGDDYWIDAGKLERQVILLEEDGSVIMCAENAVVISGELKFTFSNRKTGFVSTRDLVRFRQFATASIVYRRGPICDFVQTHKFYYGDAPLMIKASLLGRVHYSAIQSSVYRRHEGGVTARIQGSFRIAKQHMKYTDDLESLVGHRFLRIFNYRRACVYYDLSRYIDTAGKHKAAKVCAAKARSFDCLIGLKRWFKASCLRVIRRMGVPRTFTSG
jgi:glycosyltransferase involved in cell wall biosynthesis